MTLARKSSKLVCGVGVLGEGHYRSREDGKMTREYRLWANMLQRCYDEGYQLRNPTYEGCHVHKRWLNFQNFAADVNAMPNAFRDGWQLDKDLLVNRSKIYSPLKCVFLPSELNALLRTSRAHGVGFCATRQKFQVTVKLGKDKQKNLGRFDTREEANIVAKNAWAARITKFAVDYHKELPDRAVRRLLMLGRYNVK